MTIEMVLNQVCARAMVQLVLSSEMYTFKHDCSTMHFPQQQPKCVMLTKRNNVTVYNANLKYYNNTH
jgi:hypothetical protein